MANRSERPQKEVLKLKWGVVIRIVTPYMFSFRLGSLMMESSQDALYSVLKCISFGEWLNESMYEFGLLGIVRPACFVFSMSSSPLRGWKRTHKATNHILLVKIIHFVVSQKRVCEATGPVPAAMARGTSIQSEREPMQVLDFRWGMTRGTSSVVMSFTCEHVRHVQTWLYKTGEWRREIEWNPAFGGGWEVLLWRC